MRCSFVSLLLLAMATARAAPLPGWVQGTASFFGGPKDADSNAYKLSINSGSCGYGDLDPKMWPSYNVAGLSPSNALFRDRPMNSCGSCLEVACDAGPEVCYSDQPVTVVVTDQCAAASCSSHNINIHVFGFEALAPLRFGRVSIRYRLVECSPPDPITIHISDYRVTEGGWMRVALKNVGGDASISAVELSPATGTLNTTASWMAFRNAFGAVWEVGFNGQRLPSPPLDLRITNSLGQQVVVQNFVAFAGITGDVATTAQFPSPHEDADPDSGAVNEALAPVPAGLAGALSVTVGKAIPPAAAGPAFPAGGGGLSQGPADPQTSNLTTANSTAPDGALDGAPRVASGGTPGQLADNATATPPLAAAPAPATASPAAPVPPAAPLVIDVLPASAPRRSAPARLVFVNAPAFTSTSPPAGAPAGVPPGHSGGGRRMLSS